MSPTPALPVLFVLDSDRKSLDHLVADLSGRFGNDFAAAGETSPVRALEAVRGMAAADRPVALLLVDASGAEFLADAHALYPRAARVLLVDRRLLRPAPPCRPSPSDAPTITSCGRGPTTR